MAAAATGTINARSNHGSTNRYQRVAKGHGGGQTTTEHGSSKNKSAKASKDTANRTTNPGGQTGAKAATGAQGQEETGRERGDPTKKTTQAGT